MTTGERLLLHVANASVIVTGALYFVMKQLLEPADPFAVVGHPWQPHVQHLHVLAGPLLVFAVGVIWRGHAAVGLRSGRRTGSGFMLVLLLGPIAASGYLLQISAEPFWRTAFTWIHVGSSSLWILAFGVHALGAIRRLARRLTSSGARTGRSARPDPRPGSAASDRARSGPSAVA